jgi:tRNA pseudouridine55 synthase
MAGDIILVDKPTGMTSFDVIRVLRKKLGVWKMGHAGTLDPLATGLLLIGVGDATKRLADLIGLPKSYEAEILLGTRTDSGDVDGAVLEKKDIPDISIEQMKKVVESMVGELDLAVPIYSAIKRGGRPLYDYARSGDAVEIPVKKMKVTEATLLSYRALIVTIRVHVASGTYVRSLAEELARRIGTIGTIQSLRRLSVGEYKVENAKKLEDF